MKKPKLSYVIPAKAGIQSKMYSPKANTKSTGSPIKLGMTKKEAVRFAKYMVGGSLYFWVGYGVFALCYSGFHWDWLPSKVVSDAIGWTSNYIVQRFWAFSDHISLSEMQHASRYVFIESIGFVLDYLIIWGLKAIGISPYIGFFLSAGFFTIWSYLWYKYWVFPEKRK